MEDETEHDFCEDVRYLENFGYVPPPPVGVDFYATKDVDDWFLAECQRSVSRDDIPF